MKLYLNIIFIQKFYIKYWRKMGGNVQSFQMINDWVAELSHEENTSRFTINIRTAVEVYHYILAWLVMVGYTTRWCVSKSQSIKLDKTFFHYLGRPTKVTSFFLWSHFTTSATYQRLIIHMQPFTSLCDVVAKYVTFLMFITFKKSYSFRGSTHCC